MIQAIYIPDGLEAYNYSVVGIRPQTADQAELVNHFGLIVADHEEYAKRLAVKKFKALFPTAKIVTAGVAKLDTKAAVQMEKV